MLKPISKEDKPKIIVMSVLVAGLAGTAVYQFTRGDERLPEAAALAAKNPPKDGSAVASASAAPAGGTMQAGQAVWCAPPHLARPLPAMCPKRASSAMTAWCTIWQWSALRLAAKTRLCRSPPQ